ncbi:hypothetical protein EV401DRAFT_1172589 [Pisolithus croceorrhizus]|nr:hypothetical protein EV401DRAFT_1172589 [Pisolithus croceorrhizus]
MSPNENSWDGILAYLRDIAIPSMGNDSGLTSLANDGTPSNDSWIPHPNYGTPIDASLTSLENYSSLQHHEGPNSTPFTLDFVAQENPTVDNRVNNSDGRPLMRCLYPLVGGAACLCWITCCDVPKHFREVHGIKNLPRGHQLPCYWDSCGHEISRHNFVRHIREHHLKHDRNSTHKCSVKHTQGCNMGG